MGASLEELVEAGGLGRADSYWNVGIGHTVLLMLTESDRKEYQYWASYTEGEKKKMAPPSTFIP